MAAERVPEATASAAPARRTRAQQLSLDLPPPPATWGGRRRGAGRKPKGARPLVPHCRRPRHERRNPIHVTTRIVRGVAYLRGHRIYPAIRRALCAACNRLGVRIVHFSVQSDHIHLIVEAEDEVALGRAMKGFGVRLARQLNRATGRKGQVIADRYHAHYLRTPSETRRSLVYVLQNAFKHSRDPRALGSTWTDAFSSAAFFPGWSERCRRWIPARDAPAHPLHGGGPVERPVADPHSWLLTTGWLRAGGPIDTSERPIEPAATRRPRATAPR